MRNFILGLCLMASAQIKCQVFDWQKTREWKIYKISTGKGLKFSLDTLKNFSFILMNDDTLHKFMKSAEQWPKNKTSVWMGAYYSSCVIDGKLHKIDISVYGGFFYDEFYRSYFQIPAYLVNDWMEWLGSMKARVNELP